MRGFLSREMVAQSEGAQTSVWQLNVLMTDLHLEKTLLQPACDKDSGIIQIGPR